MFLPDVNVWIGLFHAQHPSHSAAKQWFDGQADADSVAFCRMTQLAFLRLLTTQQVMREQVVTQGQAWLIYERLRSDPRITFQAEPLDLERVQRKLVEENQISPKRWADDYLIAISETAGLTLVTFDKAVAARSGNAVLLKT